MIQIFQLMVSIALLGLLGYWSLTIKRKLRMLDSAVSAIGASHWNAELLLRDIPGGVFPTAPGGWAAGSDMLVELLRNIREHNYTTLVELGSGLSTVVIGLELKRRGTGKLVSIESDTAYAARTRAQVAAAGLSDYVEVRISNLEHDGADSIPWYESTVLNDLSQVDFVFVDGPPATIHPLIRQRALPFFWPRLRQGAQLIFDDADRAGERAFIVDWAAANPDCTVEWLPVVKGGAIVRKFE